MFYLEETLNLEPAAPVTMDKLVEYAQKEIVPAVESDGFRIFAAWYSNAEWFGQVRHVYEFEDFASIGKHWNDRKTDERWIDIEKNLSEMAPQRRFNILEDLNGIPAAVTQKAIEDSQKNPLGKYSLAILHVVPGMLDQFKAGLAASDGTMPIVASWTPVTGNRNVFIDVWKGTIAQDAYAPAADEMKEFFANLRPGAPREKVVNYSTLPYSTLK